MYNVALSKGDRHLVAKALLAYAKYDETLVHLDIFCLEMLAVFVMATDAETETFTLEEALMTINAIDFVAPVLDGEFDADADQLRYIKTSIIKTARPDEYPVVVVGRPDFAMVS